MVSIMIMEISMETKTCVRCNNEKPKTSEFFFFRNKKKGWLSSFCKVCKKEHRSNNMKSELNNQRNRRALTKCKKCNGEKQKGFTYCSECKLTMKRDRKKYDKCIYKSRLRKATPPWADKEYIRDFYEKRPDGFHVDHIVPIRGEFVCGLHVKENLQYLPAKENMVKSNEFNDGNHYELI